MAKTVSDPKIGQLVYPVYTPQKVGRIEKVKDAMVRRGGVDEQYVYVRISKGSRWESVLHLRDFDALIAEHEKKLVTLRGYVTKLDDNR